LKQIILGIAVIILYNIGYA